MKVSILIAELWSLANFYFYYLATSAVDLDTDQAIQEIIHGPAFANVTMLIIAYAWTFSWFFYIIDTNCSISHRLNTILESDRVVVMDSGAVSAIIGFAWEQLICK